MADSRPTLVLAHSPDPDDVFMWWPLTGKIRPQESVDPLAEGLISAAKVLQPPAMDTGGIRFVALPADIEVLNRRAAAVGDLDITALSVRTWADVRGSYAITRCGASFGDGFGPKLVCRADHPTIGCINCIKPPEVRIAVPGVGTTAFLMLGLALGEHAMRHSERFIEMPFDQIIGAVSRREVDAGLVIHEGQLTFADAGLRLVLDVGQWWKLRTGLKLPLGVNAIHRNLDRRFGPGTIGRISHLLKESVAYAMERWDESVRYTMPFAEANARRGGGEAPTLERVDRYCRMYVSGETRDMGEQGREAIRRLLMEGAAAGLSPGVSEVELV
jgi:1,4-dihydroxy-6-naphthoate synthase